jgi:hypothetical protein
MKTLKTKRQEALVRRRENLADYCKGNLPHGCRRIDIKRKHKVCELDIEYLEKKLAAPRGRDT